MNNRIRLALIGSIGLADGLAAQAVSGVVRHDSTGQPIPGVEVFIERLDRSAVTDQAGRYVIGGITAGDHVLLVRLVGYRPVRMALRVGGPDTVWANVMLTPSAQPLEPVEVSASATEYHLRVFDENRRRGFGKFFDSTELRRWANHRITDLLRRVPGVDLVTANGAPCSPALLVPCYAVSTRRLGANREPCFMRVFVDGVPSRLLDMKAGLPVHYLDGIEVYRSAGEVPAEYNSASSACGVIALWTRKP